MIKCTKAYFCEQLIAEVIKYIKAYFCEQLIAELEEKPKMIEAERHNLELNGDLMELKPISTRKLRRRAADPTGTD